MHAPNSTFQFLEAKAMRGEALVLIRRAIREGWMVATEDRERLRGALEDLLASGELRSRQAGRAAAILADLVDSPFAA